MSSNQGTRFCPPGLGRTWGSFLGPGRQCSFKERDPTMKLTCSTFHPWCCIVVLRALRRDSYWFSTRKRTRMRYWSVTSLMRLNMIPECRRPLTSTRWTVETLCHPSLNSISSPPRYSDIVISNSSESSSQIVCRRFSPVIHMNFDLVETNLTSSPWITRQYLWWTTVWVTDRTSNVCWMWSRLSKQVKLKK